MEPNAVSAFRHHKSPSSERFLELFSQPPSENANRGFTDDGDELDEDEVFWTGDFSEPKQNHQFDPPSTNTDRRKNFNSMSFRKSENFGILAALPEDDKKRGLGDRQFLYRKASVSPSSSESSSASSSSRMILAIPKPAQSIMERECSMSAPIGKFQSAPVNVPVMPKWAASGRNRAVLEEDDDKGEDEMLPPHEIVARGSTRSSMTTFSVLEGVGRTLKGRDLRQELSTSAWLSWSQATASHHGYQRYCCLILNFIVLQLNGAYRILPTLVRASNQLLLFPTERTQHQMPGIEQLIAVSIIPSSSLFF
ncbi:hypothetical protein NE237_005115 [Protea cynaroides]|uniref:Uncharacterized protein n=1 Tax=Protea cynaroides TaxID=273540 RepID=A0A9Q0KKR2_9MAGN|nr:hypothetical protein NE237_005115 [Protea cynaroides]